jgi:hypothetical protein
MELMTGWRTGLVKRVLVIGLSAWLAAACGASQQSTSPPSTSASPTSPSARPGTSVPASPVPTVEPTPTPTPVVVASWSKPQVVAKTACLVASVVIDDAGQTHVASACDTGVMYSVSNGSRWESTRLARPADRIDQGPQLAVDGGVLYLAFTRVKVEDGGCGDNGLLDVGVFVRRRELPAGDWSSPERIGPSTDGLLGLRVVDGTIHLTVKDREDNRLYYEKVANGSVERYRLPGGAGEAALRIGDDGRARIIYLATNNLQYAVFDGSGFSHSSIPGSTLGWGASLVLDAQNHAHAVWTRSWHDGGCAEPDPLRWFGTYYGTNESGAWTYRRVSSGTNGASLTVNTETGQLHVAVAGGGGIRYLSKTGSGPWKTSRITTDNGWGPIIKLDQHTGKLVVVYNGTENTIFAVTADAS